MEEVDHEIRISPIPMPDEDPDSPSALNADSKSHSSKSSSPKSEPENKAFAAHEIFPSAPEAPEENSDSSSSDKEHEVVNENIEKEYSEPTYQNPKKTIEEKIAVLSGFGIDISVTNPQVKSSAFRKHILYTVSGTDSIGGFQVQRRYKEFLALRKVLIVEWPGVCIIQLPPKQSMGNLNPDFVENRRKLLEHFIKSISKNNYLLISEEFQLFLRGPTDFHKTGLANRSANYNQIAQKYNRVFEQFAFYTRNEETDANLLAISKFFNEGKDFIEKVERQCLINQQIFKDVDNGTSKIMEHIKDLTAFYGEKVVEVYARPNSEDPYDVLLNWCRNVLLEIKGITECLSRRSELEKFKNILTSKIEEERANIVKRQLGKKKVIQYFNKKSNEYYISVGENEIKNLQTLIESIDTVLNVSSALILQEEIPDFKSKKENSLRIVIEISCEKTQKEIEAIISQFRDLESRI